MSQTVSVPVNGYSVTPFSFNFYQYSRLLDMPNVNVTLPSNGMCQAEMFTLAFPQAPRKNLLAVFYYDVNQYTTEDIDVLYYFPLVLKLESGWTLSDTVLPLHPNLAVNGQDICSTLAIMDTEQRIIYRAQVINPPL